MTENNNSQEIPQTKENPLVEFAKQNGMSLLQQNINSGTFVFKQGILNTNEKVSALWVFAAKKKQVYFIVGPLNVNTPPLAVRVEDVDSYTKFK